MALRIFFHTFSMTLYHKWDVKNDFAYLLNFFSLESLGSERFSGTKNVAFFKKGFEDGTLVATISSNREGRLYHYTKLVPTKILEIPAPLLGTSYVMHWQKFGGVFAV